MTEFIQRTYAFLGAAFRDGCSDVYLDRTHIARLKEGRIVGNIPMQYGSDSIYDVMYSTLLKILERDHLLQKRLQVLNQNANEVRLKLIY